MEVRRVLPIVALVISIIACYVSYTQYQRNHEILIETRQRYLMRFAEISLGYGQLSTSGETQGWACRSSEEGDSLWVTETFKSGFCNSYLIYLNDDKGGVIVQRVGSI